MSGQSVELSGKVISTANIENIHVVNATQQLFTITNTHGEFHILVKLNDTLRFTSIQHIPKTLIISEEILTRKTVIVTLEEQVNQLEEVRVGKVLTGDLMADIKNTTGKAPLNFFDLGIPGYTGKIATQSERRLDQANGEGVAFKTLLLQALTLNVAVDPIINAISGRTKTLKSHVEIERKANLMRRIKVTFSKTFFESNPLAEEKRIDFFYFCEEDIHFLEACENKSDFEVLLFLEKKYVEYIENQKQ